MNNLSKIAALTLALALVGTNTSQAGQAPEKTSNKTTKTTTEETDKINPTIEQPPTTTEDSKRNKRLNVTRGRGQYIYLTSHDQRHLLTGGFDDILSELSGGDLRRSLFRHSVTMLEKHLKHHGICANSHRLEFSTGKDHAKCVNF